MPTKTQKLQHCSKFSWKLFTVKAETAAAAKVPGEVGDEEEGVAHDRPPDPDPKYRTKKYLWLKQEDLPTYQREEWVIFLILTMREIERETLLEVPTASIAQSSHH